jgi:hypothetical protein
LGAGGDGSGADPQRTVTVTERAAVAVLTDVDATTYAV